MSRKRGRALSGWLIVDKPLGVGSTNVVAQSRRLFDAQKAGHAGTLDPLATGVLPIAFGQATRTIPFIMDATKKYQFKLNFGESRTTDDREGEVLETCAHRPSDAEIRTALTGFIGTIMQTPPIYSALKVGGARAYDMARKGLFPELKPRPARIDAVTLQSRPDADHAVFAVQSGKGVYMRALARDIARACGTVGHISMLRRTKCGPFDLSKAVSLDTLDRDGERAVDMDGHLLPLTAALDDIPVISVSGEDAQALRWGQTVSVGQEPGFTESGMYRVTCAGAFVGLCRVEDERLKPAKIFDAMQTSDLA